MGLVLHGCTSCLDTLLHFPCWLIGGGGGEKAAKGNREKVKMGRKITTCGKEEGEMRKRSVSKKE